MSVVPGFNNPAIDDLIQSSLESEHKLEWIPYEKISDIKYIHPTQIDNVYYAGQRIMLLCLGNNEEERTPTLVSEFARIYSLPIHKYKNDVSHFRRYSKWLECRNQ